MATLTDFCLLQRRFHLQRTFASSRSRGLQAAGHDPIEACAGKSPWQRSCDNRSIWHPNRPETRTPGRRRSVDIGLTRMLACRSWLRRDRLRALRRREEFTGRARAQHLARQYPTWCVQWPAARAAVEERSSGSARDRILRLRGCCSASRSRPMRSTVRPQAGYERRSAELSGGTGRGCACCSCGPVALFHLLLRLAGRQLR